MGNSKLYEMCPLKLYQSTWIHEKIITQPVIISIKTKERAKMKLHNIHSRWNDALKISETLV